MTDLKPGLELDILIAQKIMSYSKYDHTGLPIKGKMITETGSVCSGENAVTLIVKRFSPSTNISDAWEVVEKLYEWKFVLTCREGLNTAFWTARFEPPGSTEVEAETAPHAICLAALKAVGQ